MALFLLAALGLLLIPGPSVLYIITRSVAQGRRAGLASVLGVELASLTHAAAAAFGLSALLLTSAIAFSVVKYLGAAYLIYLGVTLWRARSQTVLTPESSFQPALPAAYLRGLLTNLSNPKSVVYFGSIFALFMAPATPLWVKTLAVGIVLLDTVLWYGTVAAMFSRAKIQRGYAALEKPINRTTGALMMGLGARLILVRD